MKKSKITKFGLRHLIKKVADELSEKGTYDILLDTLTALPKSAVAYQMAIGLNK